MINKERVKYWVGRWDRESFILFLKEMNWDKNIIYNDPSSNTVLIKISTFEQMHTLFRHRAQWSITKELYYWKEYITKGRTQYVWLNFNDDEEPIRENYSKIAFTTAKNKNGFKILYAYNAENYTLGNTSDEIKTKFLELGIKLNAKVCQ